LLDYDTLFRRLNMGTMQGNWLAPWGTAFHFLADYRMTPALPDRHRHARRAVDLGADAARYLQRSRAAPTRAGLSAKAALASAGLTHPLNQAWQVGVDLNVSRISHTDGTNNVPGTPGTGLCQDADRTGHRYGPVRDARR